MRYYMLIAVLVFFVSACNGTKPNPVANQQLMLTVPESLLQPPKPLEQL